MNKTKLNGEIVTYLDANYKCYGEIEKITLLTTWKESEVYTKGDTVTVEGTTYEAKWWTKGDNPSKHSDRDDVWKTISGNPEIVEQEEQEQELSSINITKIDDRSIKTYEKTGYKPDGSGSNISYTSTRVCPPLYNQYKKRESGQPKLSAYITDWAQYDARLQDDESAPEKSGRGFNLDNISPLAYDEIIFSFMGIYGDQSEKGQLLFNPQENNNQREKGECAITDPWGDLATTINVGNPNGEQYHGERKNWLENFHQDKAKGLLGGLRDLKERAKSLDHQLDLSFVVAGWTLSSYFSEVAESSNLTDKFVNSIVEVFDRFPMFSGVHLDWEYPGAETYGAVDKTRDYSKDGANFAILMSKLRSALDTKITDRKCSIDIASSPNPKTLEKTNITALLEAGLDRVYLMAYDYFGTGWASKLAHHANLESYWQGLDDSKFSGEKAVQWLIDNGVKPSQIHFGYAGYGRAGCDAHIDTLTYKIKGKALGSFENGAPEFYDILANYLDLEASPPKGKNGFTLYTDEKADADYLYNSSTKQFLSIDTPRSVYNKGHFVADMELGGAFVWSGDQDNGLLANAIKEGMGFEMKTSNIEMEPFYKKGDIKNLG